MVRVVIGHCGFRVSASPKLDQCCPVLSERIMQSRKPPPDFVIVGAPKCGTTALYKTLQRHPGIAMSPAKEPYYFASEYPGHRMVRDEAAYDELFAHAREGQVRGEASAIYLSSENAIRAILNRRGDAKFIALVRDPVEMFISFHNECLKGLDEDEADPEKAWRLQEERAAGRRIPKLCSEPGYLHYRKICSLGSQIQRLFELVPADRRLVISMEQLDKNAIVIHQEIASFLGVEDIGMADFGRENVYARHRITTLAWLLRSFSTEEVLRRFRFGLKPHLNKLGIRPLSWAYKLSLQSTSKPTLSDGFREELREEFRGEVTLLEELLTWDLSHWRMGTAPPKNVGSRPLHSTAGAAGSRTRPH